MTKNYKNPEDWQYEYVGLWKLERAYHIQIKKLTVINNEQLSY